MTWPPSPSLTASWPASPSTEDAVRAIIREAIPEVTEQQVALLEPLLVDLFMEYAAEHYKLVAKDERRP
jgi:hypothetical protein